MKKPSGWGPSWLSRGKHLFPGIICQVHRLAQPRILCQHGKSHALLWNGVQEPGHEIHETWAETAQDGSAWILGRLEMRDTVCVQRMTNPPNSAALSSFPNPHRTHQGAFFHCLYISKRSAPFEKQNGRAHLLTQGGEDSGQLPRPPPAHRRDSPQAPRCRGWCQVTTSPAQGRGTCAEISLPKFRLHMTICSRKWKEKKKGVDSPCSQF